VGVLLDRFFGASPNIISARSRDYYGGKQQFGDWSALISHSKKTRDVVFSEVLETFGESTVQRILCVPFFPDDVRTAIAAKEIFGVPMCAYIMDDQNVYAGAINDELIAELLRKSALRLAISPEIRAAYQQKYGMPMWFMPPLAPAEWIPDRLQSLPDQAEEHPVVMIGNVWSARWLEMLRKAVKSSGVRVHWYSPGDYRHLAITKADLAADLIDAHDPAADPDLVAILRRSGFALVPTGTLDERDDRWALSQFSLPSRLIYLMATSHIPVLVLGSPKSAAARFVTQFDIGLVCDYDPSSFRRAVRQMTDREANTRMRANAFAIASRFSDAGAAEWIWKSLARGAPVDSRFEDLMPRELPDVSHCLSGPPRIPQGGVEPEEA